MISHDDWSQIDPAITDNIINNFLSEFEREKFKEPNDSKFHELISLEIRGVKSPFIRYKIIKNHKQRLDNLFSEYDFIDDYHAYKERMENLPSEFKLK